MAATELYNSVVASRLRANLICAAAGLAVSIGFGSASSGWPAFVLGLMWAQFAEYAWHRFILHGPDSAARRQHLEHHRDFAAEHTINIEDDARNGINEDPMVFPTAFAIHAAFFFVLLGGFPAAFMAAICVHYAAFEMSHWAIHVRENPIDRVLRHLPGIRLLRGWQILHHFEHHDFPGHNFSFTPPYAGDVLLGTRRSE